MNEIMRYLSFSDLFHGYPQVPSMMPQIARFSFSWLNNIPLCVCVCVCVCVCEYHIFFVHSSIYGHFGCFHVLVIVNNAAVNIGVVYRNLFQIVTSLSSDIPNQR